jgi:hypothetical protein
MASLSDLSDMTGMPSGKPTHRGKRSRGTGPKPAGLPGAAQGHLDAVNSAAAAGNHGAVKSSAFHLVNALHALSKPKGGAGALPPGGPPPGAEPDGDEMGAPSPQGPPPGAGY